MISRRTFIKQSGVLAGVALVAPSFVGAAAPAKTVGLQLYSLRDQLPADPRAVIQKVAKAGYKLVETYGYEKGKFWGLTPETVAAVLKANGLKTPSGHYSSDAFLSKSEMEDEFEALTTVAHTLGQEYITIPYIPEEMRKSADDYKRLAARLNRAGEICKAANLKLAYHNHDFEFTQYGDETGYDIFLKNTDHNLVSFEMDLYWVVRAGKDPVALFNKYPGRFKMWHVKDMDKGDKTLNTEIGTGSIDFINIVKNSKNSGIKYVIVEQENYKIDPYQSITQSSAYVKAKLLK